ncbi:NUDIX domain-containing protein [Roseovarius sp. LXJ103]|uniref:NUDIX domain-containing protein n=1 Tax=Roseovarius carneus TaxID=2853164 RepID=UPI000D605B6F|nr:NUDIX domain-containing protein [Roseovarius carneus]MBZ8119770.1 NUDIX domain-containing protein [Roseovarius carneus]PWE34627.1 tellurium resistance protein [Pelagicola sp. LXJ1103]
MSALFVYGSLRDRALLEIVLGHAGAQVCAGTLPDHRVSWAEGQVFPYIEGAPGVSAEGLLLSGLTATDITRLDFFEGGFGYDLRAVEVLAGGMRPAEVYFPRPGLWTAGAPFVLGDWQATYGPLSRHAAREAMGYFGRFSGAELAVKMPMIRARAAAQLLAGGVSHAIRSSTPASAVEVIAEESPHAGFFVTKALTLRHPKFDGTLTEPLRREVFVSTDAAIVLPYDPVRDRVLLIEQFRMGPFGRGDPHPWMLEPVAGRVDPGETPEAAAYRECAEEAGLTLTGLEQIASYYPSPGAVTEYFHTYLGLADIPDDLPRLGGLETEAEDIRLHLMPFERAHALIETGEADNGPLILALMWLARERARLRAVA